MFDSGGRKTQNCGRCSDTFLPVLWRKCVHELKVQRSAWCCWPFRSSALPLPIRYRDMFWMISEQTYYRAQRCFFKGPISLPLPISMESMNFEMLHPDRKIGTAILRICMASTPVIRKHLNLCRHYFLLLKPP